MDVNIPAFMSMGIKGGTGKSVNAVNIAKLLSQYYKVGLVDLDIDSPNLPMMLGIKEDMKVNKNHHFIPIHVTNNLKVFSMGAFNQRGEQGMSRSGEMNRLTIKQALQETEWVDIDIFVLDQPAGSSDEFRASIEVFPSLIGAVIVTLPTTTEDLLRCFDLTSRFMIPILGVIENMYGAITECGVEPICPKCQKVFKPLGDSVNKKLCEERGIEYLGSIPVLSEYSTQLKKGNPLIPEQYNEPILKAIELIRKELSVNGN